MPVFRVTLSSLPLILRSMNYEKEMLSVNSKASNSGEKLYSKRDGEKVVSKSNVVKSGKAGRVIQSVLITYKKHSSFPCIQFQWRERARAREGEKSSVNKINLQKPNYYRNVVMSFRIRNADATARW